LRGLSFLELNRTPRNATAAGRAAKGSTFLDLAIYQGRMRRFEGLDKECLT
jgi:hypothetical protein